MAARVIQAPMTPEYVSGLVENHLRQYQPKLLKELQQEGPDAVRRFVDQQTEGTLSQFRALQKNGLPHEQAANEAIRSVALSLPES